MSNNNEIYIYEYSNDIIFEGDNGEKIDLSQNIEWNDYIYKKNEPLYEFNINDLIIL